MSTDTNKTLPSKRKFTKILELVRNRAWMVELVDTRDLKSLSFGSEGSSPSPGTISPLMDESDRAKPKRTALPNKEIWMN